MTKIAEYAAKWNRDVHNNFAVACYKRYEVRGLEQIIHRFHSPNLNDTRNMQTWHLTVEEWHDAVSAALFDKRSA